MEQKARYQITYVSDEPGEMRGLLIYDIKESIGAIHKYSIKSIVIR